MTQDLQKVLAFFGTDVPERSGNVQVLCPVHDEIHPSCSVNLNEGVLNCFSCGFAGDAYSLIAHKESLTDFREVLRRYEQITGEPVKSKRPEGPRPGRRGWRPSYRRKVA